MVRNKPAKVLRGEALDNEIRRIALEFPEYVHYEGPLHKAVAFAMGTKPRGRRTAIDLADYPSQRAAAVAKLGRQASQRAIGDALGVDEKTIRNYDRRLLRGAPLRNAPDGRDGA
jgi:hypothetical protein